MPHSYKTAVYFVVSFHLQEHKESKTREKKDVEKLKEPRIRLKKESLDTDSDDDRQYPLL